jgi:hypothetical protein
MHSFQRLLSALIALTAISTASPGAALDRDTVIDRVHAANGIVYHDYARVGGSLVATRWAFTLYDPENGTFTGDLGEVTLENPRFVSLRDRFFARPPNSAERQAPSAP